MVFAGKIAHTHNTETQTNKHRSMQADIHVMLWLSVCLSIWACVCLRGYVYLAVSYQ